MERSEGKLQVNSYCRKGWIVEVIDENGNHILHGVSSTKALGNADHLVECWNAFEKGGLVSDLLKALKRDAELATVAILMTPTGPKRNRLTEINIFRLQAIALAEAEKSDD